MKRVTPDVAVRKVRDPFSSHLFIKIFILTCVVSLLGIGIIIPVKLVPKAISSINAHIDHTIHHSTPHELVATPMAEKIVQNIDSGILLTTTDTGITLEATSTNISARKINITHNGNPAGTIIIIEK